MPNTEIPHQSHSENSSPPKSNGLEVGTPADPPRYYVEDFSQHAINRGQVEINNLLTVVNKKTSAALEKLAAAVEKLANKEKVDINVESLKETIKAVQKANEDVAGPFPPGCNVTVVDRPSTS